MLNTSKLLFAILSAIHLLSTHSSSAQNLTAVLCNARLPTKRGDVASLYDGYDTIYLFGGNGNSENDSDDATTLKYSISQDTLAETGEQPPYSGFGGGIVMNKLGNIYYLMGYGGYYVQDILEYFPETETFTNASKLHTANFGYALIQPDEDTALIIGGRWDPDIIQSLNLNTLESEIIADYPILREEMRYRISAIFVEEQNVIYIFDGRSIHNAGDVIKWDRSTNQFEFLSTYLPLMQGGSQAVWDGRHGYIIGGYGSNGEPYDGFLQFDPATGDVKFIRVEGYPGKPLNRFAETSAVYVEKLNRIYMFGGHTANASIRWRDEIWHISLDPLGGAATTRQDG